MNAGRVQQVDTPLALYDRPANRFVAGFIGSPAMNFVEGTVSDRRAFTARGDALVIAGRGTGCADRAWCAQLVLGVRPEDITVTAASSAPGASDPFVPVPARVDLIEPLGNETLVHPRRGHTRSPRACWSASSRTWARP